MKPTDMTSAKPLNEIIDGVAIPFAYKMGYMINSYREPSFRSIEAKFGLTRPEILTLIFLYHRDGISASDICDFSGHLKNNISRAVTALEKKGLLKRESDPLDQRRWVLLITEDGRNMHDRFMPGLIKREEEMMKCFNHKERAEFEVLLRKLCAHAASWSGVEHI
jgi:MarR family transcriptional regulator, temperature-dependent positive regulator of motility